MQRNDIIRMALESGFGCDTDGHIFTDNQDGICDEYLERFAELVAALEREACARLAERRLLDDDNAERRVGHHHACKSIAADIRARSQQ